MKTMKYLGNILTRGDNGEQVKYGVLIETLKESQNYGSPIGKINVSDSVFGHRDFSNDENWKEI